MSYVCTFQEQKLHNYSLRVIVLFSVSMTHAKLHKMTNDSEQLKKKAWTNNNKNHIKLQTEMLHSEICGENTQQNYNGMKKRVSLACVSLWRMNRNEELNLRENYLIHLKLLIFHPRTKKCYFSVRNDPQEEENEFMYDFLSYSGMEWSYFGVYKA